VDVADTFADLMKFKKNNFVVQNHVEVLLNSTDHIHKSITYF